MTESRTRGLGGGAQHLGLDALLARVEAEPAALDPATSASQPSLHYLSIQALSPGRFQPRGMMDEEALVELSDSLRQHGMMQPIVVRPLEQDRYEIIAGERRWRAAKLAGLATVPVVTHALSDEEAMVLALVENVQRVDLSVVEQARALQGLIEMQKITHQEASQLVGKSRAYVSNLLRLLDLEPSVLASLAAGEMEMGHARALLRLSPSDQITFSAALLRGGWSVRLTEARVREHIDGAAPAATSTPSLPKVCEAWGSTLTHRFSVPVDIRPGRGDGGQVVLRYRSQDELKRLYDQLLEGIES